MPSHKQGARSLIQFSLLCLSTALACDQAAKPKLEQQQSEITTTGFLAKQAAQQSPIGCLNPPGPMKNPIVTTPEPLAPTFNPGHTVLKHLTKSPLNLNAPLPAGPAVPANDQAGKQAAYQQQWAALQPTLAQLPSEEQEARRAQLKRSVVGF